MNTVYSTVYIREESLQALGDVSTEGIPLPITFPSIQEIFNEYNQYSYSPVKEPFKGRKKFHISKLPKQRYVWIEEDPLCYYK